MAGKDDARTERETVLHEMSTVVMTIDADVESIRAHVIPAGAEIHDDLSEATKRLVRLFQRLRKV